MEKENDQDKFVSNCQKILSSKSGEITIIVIAKFAQIKVKTRHEKITPFFNGF